MIDTYKKEFRIVTGSTAAEFQDALNTTMEDLAKDKTVQNINFQFNLNAGHCAYVYYDKHVRIAENAEDEFELRGIRFYCCDCPFYKPIEDKRVKYTPCGKGRHRTSANDTACGEFYAAMAKLEKAKEKGGEA